VRFFVSFLTISSIILVFTGRTIYQIKFLIFRKTIAATHCINKNKPELLCNGICYLSQKIKLLEKVEPISENRPNNIPIKYPEIICSQSFDNHNLQLEESLFLISFYGTSLYSSPILSVSTPPPEQLI